MPVTIKPTRPLAKRIDGDYVVRPHPMRSSRRALAWGAALVAVGWFAWRGVSYTGERPRLAGAIANPGPVSSAHANFEHDCTACHTGGAGDRFMRGVEDSACLTCHDGAIHDVNQKIAPDAHGVSRAAFTLAQGDDSHPQRMRSAACATCHVEHRDRTALAATSDAHCVVCHADLRNAARTPPRVAASVTSFDAANHPPFGRSLRGADGKMTDPTRLNFNHAIHRKVKDGALRDCAVCHQTDRATSAGDGRYMRPIAYTRHCASCHPLDVTADVRVAHEDLALVRTQLAGVAGMYRARLAAMTPDERNVALAGGATGSRGSSRRKDGGGGAKITEDAWVNQKVAKFVSEIEAWFDSRQTSPGYEEVKARFAATQPAAAVADPKVIEYYVVYGTMSRLNACALCHDVDSSRPLLSTVPTTRPASAPYRRFTSSHFNHDAHRNVTCTDCHADGVTSSATSDVLLPEMTTRGAQSGLSCVDCHHSGNTSTRSAPSACATCHLYHDRTMERSRDGGTLGAAAVR